MSLLPERIMQKLERLNNVYFSDPARTITLAKGEMLVGQGEECRRIYLILEGSLAAYRQADTEEGCNLPPETAARKREVFRAGPGSYVCVQSFFTELFHSSNDIIALEASRLAYVDDTTQAEDADTYGTLEHQFIPVIMHELKARNLRIFSHATEKEEAIRLLQRAEMAATLGQLSAGIAHELNNAVGVISRRMEFVAEQLAFCLAEENPLNSKLFTLGYIDKSYTPAGELRSLARQYERELDFPQDAAKALAHIAPTPETLRKYDKKFLKHLRHNYRFWELGHDLRDMQVAARHATGIVRSVKMLGGGNSARQEGVDVRESINDAMNLLGNKLKRIQVTTDLAPCPAITADVTELVQIWTNILSNACDAMEHGHTPHPAIRIATGSHHVHGVSLLPTEYVSVSITNNGPAIPEEIQEKIFQPNFTTKKLGLDFGLGLGLAIVRRVVDSYNGAIELTSSEQETAFTINLPTSQIHGNH